MPSLRCDGRTREQHQVRALLAELHDGEAGERVARGGGCGRARHPGAGLPPSAGDDRERVAVADRLQHARRVVFPAEARLDEVARHQRHGLRVARFGESDGDRPLGHEKHCAMFCRKL